MSGVVDAPTLPGAIASGPIPAPAATPSGRSPASAATTRGLIPAPVGGPAGAPAPFLASTARTVGALLRRDAAERRFVGVPFVLDFAFGIVNLLVFSFISRVLRHPAHPLAGSGGSYFDFVAVGLAFMLVVQAAASQITTRISDEQRSGTLEMLVAQPVRPAAIALGISAYPMGFSILRAASYLGIAGAVLGLDVGHANWLGVAVVLVLGAAAATGLGIALAAFTVAFDHGQTVARLLIVGLSFASGTYFPVSTLPLVLRRVSDLLPTRIALDGLRAAISGGGWVGSALLLAAATAVGLPLSIGLFGRALQFAVRRGTLIRG